MPCIWVQRQTSARIYGSISGDKYLQPNDGDVRSLREEQSAFPHSISLWPSLGGFAGKRTPKTTGTERYTKASY